MTEKLIEFLSQFIELFRCWAVVDAYERGVVLRFGKFHRRVGPGLHWTIPLGVDRVLAHNAVANTTRLHAQTLMTFDGVTVSVRAVITSSIRNMRKALLEVEGINDAIVDSCTAAVAKHVLTSTWAELRGDPSSSKLLAEAREQAKKYGVDISRIQLADMSPCKTIRLHQGE